MENLPSTLLIHRRQNYSGWRSHQIHDEGDGSDAARGDERGNEVELLRSGNIINKPSKTEFLDEKSRLSS